GLWLTTRLLLSKQLSVTLKKECRRVTRHCRRCAKSQERESALHSSFRPFLFLPHFFLVSPAGCINSSRSRLLSPSFSPRSTRSRYARRFQPCCSDRERKRVVRLACFSIDSIVSSARRPTATWTGPAAAIAKQGLQFGF